MFISELCEEGLADIIPGVGGGRGEARAARPAVALDRGRPAGPPPLPLELCHADPAPYITPQ